MSHHKYDAIKHMILTGPDTPAKRFLQHVQEQRDREAQAQRDRQDQPQTRTSPSSTTTEKSNSDQANLNLPSGAGSVPHLAEPVLFGLGSEPSHDQDREK